MCGLQFAFETLKKIFTSAPILSYASFEETFQLTTDASGTHVGGVLEQKGADGPFDVVVAFISHKLTDAERKWDTREREAFAVVWGIDQLRFYLQGKRFRVVTDCENIASVKWILNYKKAGRLSRWALLLQSYEFDIVSTPGKENGAADGLSRLETIAAVEEKLDLPEEKLDLPDLEDLRIAQMSDPLLSRVIQRIKGFPEPSIDVSEVIAYGGTFSVSPKNDLLVFSDTGISNRIVVPPKLRFQIFEHFHNMVAHLAARKTYGLMKKQFFWRGMKVDVENFVRQCESCQLNKKPQNKKAGKLQLFPATFPFEVLGMDILGPFTVTDSGNKYVLVVVDRFTRWVEIFAMPDMTAQTVADIFMNQIICRYSVPRALLTDRGSNFLSKMFSRLCERLGTNRLVTSAYHPQTNGQTEKLNRFIAAALRAYTDPNTQGDWDKFLDSIAYAYRISEVMATGYSPFFLIFGREPTLPTSILYGDKKEIAVDVRDYSMNQTRILRDAHKRANEIQAKYDRKKKEYYDRTHQDVKYFVGDLVNLFTPKKRLGFSTKLITKNSGPYTVVKKLSPVHYIIKPGVDGNPTQTAHVLRLLKYFPPVRGSNIENQSDDEPDLKESDSGDAWDSDEFLAPISRNRTSNRRRLKNSFPSRQVLSEPKILRRRVSDQGDREYLVQIGNDQIWAKRNEISIKMLNDFETLSRKARTERRGR